MTDIGNKVKQPAISKKWLYGSLAIAALLIGLFLDNDAFAAQNNLASNAVEQVKIDKEEGDVEIITDMTLDNDDFESYADDLLEDDLLEGDFTEDSFLEEDFSKQDQED